MSFTPLASEPTRGWQGFLAWPAIVAGVCFLVLAGGVAEAAARTARDRDVACRQVLILRPRAGARGLLAGAARLREAQAVAGCYTAPYADSALQEAGWPEARIWAVDTRLHAWRFLPPVPGLCLAAGRLPQRADEVLLGHELARALDARVGGTIWVAGRPFAVAGIWQPAGLARGDWLQLPCEAFARLFPERRSPDLIYLQLRPGLDPVAACAQLQAYLPQATVLTPPAFWAEERLLLRALALVAAAALILAGLMAGPAAVNALRPLPPDRTLTACRAAALGLLGAACGLAVAWSVAYLLDAQAARTYAITPIAVTPRLALLALAWPALCAALAGALARPQRAGEVARLVRSSVATATVALAAWFSLLAGGLQESLTVALQGVDTANAGRLSLEAPEWPLAPPLQERLLRLPGLQGLIVEIEAGALAAEEEGWPGQPPSGRLYGLDSPTGCTGVAVPWQLCLAQGRGLRGPYEAILGYELARGRGLKPGDAFSVYGQELTVVGIRPRWPYDALSAVNYRVDVTLEALGRLDRGSRSAARVTLLVPPVHDEAERVAYVDLARQSLPGLRVASAREELAARVVSVFPGGRPLSAGDPVAHLRALYARLHAALTLPALLVAGLAVASALDPTCREQRREAALRRLLGWPADRILTAHLATGLLIGLLGVLLGGYAAHLFAGALNAAFHGSLAWAPLRLTPRLLASTAAAILLAAALASAGPALRVAAADPARLVVAGAPLASRGSARDAACPKEARP